MPTTTGRLEELRSLEPYEFEHFVANVWEDRGWQTRVLPESKDYGIDVLATKSDPTPQKVLIQAKRYAADNPVRPREVQQYRSVLEQEPDADSVVIVTTSRFTGQAQEIAERVNVKLVDGDDLLGIIDNGRMPSTQPAASNAESPGSESLIWEVLVAAVRNPERAFQVVFYFLILVLVIYILAGSYL